MPSSPQAPDSANEARDARLYVLSPEGWEARVKHTWDKEYCYAQNPGEDFFHLLLAGEVYLLRDNEKYCLSCALRRGIVTTNRVNWQRGGTPE
jgi:hypothetical protein